MRAQSCVPSATPVVRPNDPRLLAPGTSQSGYEFRVAELLKRSTKPRTSYASVRSAPTGRGAAWLACQSGGLEVPGSNPGAPIKEAPGNSGFLLYAGHVTSLGGVSPLWQR